MWFECEQPFLSGERCVTSRKTAAKETRKYHAIFEYSRGKMAHCFSIFKDFNNTFLLLPVSFSTILYFLVVLFLRMSFRCR